MARTKTKWIEDEAVIPVKIGPYTTGTTQKTAPVAADRLLIEDSEDGYSKKWATYTSIGAGGSPYASLNETVERTTSSLTPVNAFSAGISPPSDGTYLILFDGEVYNSKDKKGVMIGVGINSTTTMATGSSREFTEQHDKHYMPVSTTHIEVGLTTSDVVYGLYHAILDDTAYIRNRRITMIKVA